MQNDELIVTDFYGELFSYTVHEHPGGHRSINPQVQELQETLFHEKQTIIENCLFGVDINPNSVKICRLRLWIELLKNAYYQQQDTANFAELQTLPNIDINIKQGNSLLSRYPLTADLQDAFGKKGHSLPAYREAVLNYKHTNSKETKKQLVAFLNEIKQGFRTTLANNDPLRQRMAKLRGTIAAMQDPDLFGAAKVDKAKLAKMKKELQKLETEREQIETNKVYEGAFEWRFEFPEVLDDAGNYQGFDVVIGNPPYIRQEELGDFKLYLKKAFATFAGTADLYVFFVEQGINLLKNGGQFSYIIPNKWMRAGYGKSLRAWLKSYTLEQLLDFGDLPVFEEATTYPLIVSVAKVTPAEGATFVAAGIHTLDFEQGLAHYVQEQGYTVQADLLPDTGWSLHNTDDIGLLEKLKKSCNTLEIHIKGNVYRGVTSGLDKAFVINESERDRILKLDPKSSELIKPYIVGKDVSKKYTPPIVNKYVIYSKWTTPIDEYPGALNHLMKFEEELKCRPEVQQGRFPWYAMSRYASAYYEEFFKPKIVYLKFQVKPAFTIDLVNSVPNSAVWFIPLNDMALLGVLNSKLGWLLISKFCTKIQNGFQLIYQNLKDIPLPNFESQLAIEVQLLVEQVLAAKQADAAADTSGLEAEIDLLVYRLYNLTYDEVLLVEPEFALSREEYTQQELISR
ncbi:Eco57I restriction-modification methylase domain-containing protein [Pontibacter beigongshangensis]|uniref:Eco57I restriction-modification methylase domain-containing protein n=1 Tax=Pontibacter beigongshangensis TaxID=2574733 RepID=UPI00293BA8FE|nr:Eco57I restriction-modification methylase domain-containing protein [Pontibacter beigongshangensis]